MSIRLLANWCSPSLYVWAQNGERVDAATLRSALGESCGDTLLISAVNEQDIRVQDPQGERAVPALVFGPAEAIDLLTSFSDPPPAICDPSVSYWAGIARLVIRLIAARQFVPRIEETEAGRLLASWRLIVQDRPILQWLETCAQAMPGVCHQITGSIDEPAHQIESFLASTADALIRRAVADDPFFARVHEKSAAGDATFELRWLSALLGSNRELRQAEDDNTAVFLQQARTWLGQLDDTQPAALRLCFALNEPEEDDEVSAIDPTWTISLHLQGADAEGEWIDAESLWQNGQAQSPILGRSIARRQAALVAELTRAAEIFPAAQALLSQPQPARMSLSTADAWAFIRHWTPLLRERDFVVMLPEWTGRPDEELGLRLLLSPNEDLDDLFDPFEQPAAAAQPRRTLDGQSMQLSSGHFGLESLMDFQWQVALGSSRLTPEQFETLVSRSTPLIKHDGHWVHIDTDAAKKALEFLKKKSSGQMTLADAFRTAFTAQRSETGLNILGLSGTKWLEELLEQSPGKSLEQFSQPPAFAGELRPYQLRGLHWLVFLDRIGLGACLADDMGLGKTIQLIALLLHEREGSGFRAQGSGLDADRSCLNPEPRTLNPAIGPTLLFAPTSVVGNWLRELQRFAPSLNVLVHHGPERLSGESFAKAAHAADVVVTSYSLAHRDREHLTRVHWHRIALDEAQKIKNPAAAGSIAIRSLYAPRRVALTGTPIENHLSELWSIMQVLNPGLLGTAADFREKFAVPIEKLGEKDRAGQLRQMIRPFVLRRTKADPAIAGDLPEKQEMKVFCNLTAEQAAIYERLVNDSLRQIDSASGIRRRGLILATLTRLKQVCNHPGLLEDNPTALDQRSGKAERLIEMLEEVLEEGDGALVFSQYRQMGHLLEKLIKNRLRAPTFFLHGGTPAKMRDQMIQQFQTAPGAPRIFLLSLKAGGLGLNLTAANHVFHYDRWWNPAVEQQATDRAHRVGQTRKVQVHKFVCIGTMEERIDRLLSEKQALADQIVGGGDDWLTNLSTDQLREYLTLSKEAVGEFE